MFVTNVHNKCSSHVLMPLILMKPLLVCHTFCLEISCFRNHKFQSHMFLTYVCHTLLSKATKQNQIKNCDKHENIHWLFNQLRYRLCHIIFYSQITTSYNLPRPHNGLFATLCRHILNILSILQISKLTINKDTVCQVWGKFWNVYISHIFLQIGC